MSLSLSQCLFLRPIIPLIDPTEPFTFWQPHNPQINVSELYKTHTSIYCDMHDFERSSFTVKVEMRFDGFFRLEFVFAFVFLPPLTLKKKNPQKTNVFISGLCASSLSSGIFPNVRFLFLILISLLPSFLKKKLIFTHLLNHSFWQLFSFQLLPSQLATRPNISHF